MKGNKLVNWEKAIQCLICLQETRHLLLKQSCTQRGWGVISKLTLCTLWQQKQQTACCVARILPQANSGVLPLPSHAHPKWTTISYMFERPWIQAADVLIPLLMSFLPQSTFFAPNSPSHSTICRSWEGRNTVEQSDCIRPAWYWSSCLFPGLWGFIHISCFQLFSCQGCSNADAIYSNLCGGSSLHSLFC